jgi:hypothetical protein
MEDYNTIICDLLKKINNVINPPPPTMDTIQEPDGSTQDVNSDIIYDNLSKLSNTIQKETDFNVSNYNNNDVNTINYEQNKQFENMKFNKIYLFFFNLGIIFLILKFAYYKKTN